MITDLHYLKQFFFTIISEDCWDHCDELKKKEIIELNGSRIISLQLEDDIDNWSLQFESGIKLYEVSSRHIVIRKIFLN